MKLYHVTKKEYVPFILKDGLLTNKFKPRLENEKIGIDSSTKAIYLVKDPNKLVKPFRPDKDSILEINIPDNIYSKMNKVEGDLEWPFMKKMGLRKYRSYRAQLMADLYPEKMTYQEAYDNCTDGNFMSPENTVCILEDIPPRYIKKYR